MKRDGWCTWSCWRLLPGSAGQVFVITGRPYKALVSGPLFSSHYREVRARLGDADLAAIWLIEPLRIRNETYQFRKEREETLHPFHLHLDRLAVTEPLP